MREVEAICAELLDAVKPLDDTPPSVQSMANIRIVEAANKAIKLIRELKSEIERLRECPKCNGSPDTATVRKDAEIGCLKQRIRQLAHRAETVMQMLDTHGPIIVPHLLDTDDNAGQFLRTEIEDARAALENSHGR